MTDPRKPGVLGKAARLYLALAETVLIPPFTPLTSTVVTPAGGTSITLGTALTLPVLSGQALGFKQVNGEYRLVRVSAAAAVGATVLTIDAAVQAITANAVAEFPCRFHHRTNLSREGSVETAKLATDDTNSWNTSEIVGLEETIETTGALIQWDAGRATAEYARRKAQSLYLRFLYPKPSAEFAHGGGFCGLAIATKMSEQLPVNAFIVGSTEFTWQGEPLEIPAALA